MPEYALISPTAEPLDVLEARAQASISSLDLDSLRMSLCIMQGRGAAEHKTRQQCLHARYVLILDCFPQAGYGTPVPFASPVGIPAYAVILPHSPAVAVVSVEYQDMTGNWQTMPSTDYVANLTMKPGIVTPTFGKVWPIVLPQIASVKITYDAGYASPFTAGGGTPATITVSGPVTWAHGAQIVLSNSGGALPAPLAAGKPYLIGVVSGGGVYTLTDTAGGALTLTDAGTGTHYIGPFGDRGVVPAGIRGWILIRAATLYESREEIAILNRGHIEELPFMDGLLDQFRTSLL